MGCAIGIALMELAVRSEIVETDGGFAE